jgi:hypothetical protein
MSLDWLRARIVCEGRSVRPPLSLQNLSDADLPDICLRMGMILDSIEFPRCEGRLINLEIFNPIDTLESDLQHREENHLVDWLHAIRRFGEYYSLDGNEPITVSSQALDTARSLADRLGVQLPQKHE